MVAPAEPLLKGKTPDMGSFRAPKGGGGKPSGMNAFEILKKSLEKEMGPNADINRTLNQISSLIGLKLAQLMQIGNTVFLVMPRGGQTAEIHLATVDPISALPERIKSGAKTLKNMGFKRAVAYVPDQGWIKVAQQTGLPIQTNQGTQTIGRDKKPMYQFILELS